MLTVSHPCIRTDRIIDFPKHDRFMKVPIENYLDLLGIEPIGPQIAVINAINDPQFRFITACLSRRTGKTYIANIIAQVIALVPGANVLLISPNYSLTTISWDLQRELIGKFDLEVVKNNQKDKVIVLSNGSSVRMGSVGQADSVVGRSYDFILFDEAAIDPRGKDAFNIQLRPTLDKAMSDVVGNNNPGAKAIFISTPRGLFSYFKEFYDRGYNDKFPEWASIHSDYKENPRIKQKDIDEAKLGMSDAEFRQEYMADFTSFEGRIWNLNIEDCVQNLTEKTNDERWMRRCDRIAGIDIGFKDPTAFVVVLFDPVDELYYIVDEFLDNRMKTSEQAGVIKKMELEYDLDMIFIDSAAAQTRFDWANDHDVSTSNAKKSINDGIAFVAGLVENDRLIIHEDCYEVLFCFDQYMWDDRTTLIREKPVHGIASHMADAVRYALYSYRA